MYIGQAESVQSHQEDALDSYLISYSQEPMDAKTWGGLTQAGKSYSRASALHHTIKWRVALWSKAWPFHTHKKYLT